MFSNLIYKTEKCERVLHMFCVAPFVCLSVFPFHFEGRGDGQGAKPPLCERSEQLG